MNTRRYRVGLKSGVLTGLWMLSGALCAEGFPSWWLDRGCMDPTVEPNDYAPVNQGQAKQMAHQAYLEFKEKLTNDCSAISNLVSGFSPTNNFLPANLGQLKHLATPFYDVLWAGGLTNGWPEGMTVGPYPWSGSPDSAKDYAMANIGQLKRLFSFKTGMDVVVRWTLDQPTNRILTGYKPLTTNELHSCGWWNNGPTNPSPTDPTIPEPWIREDIGQSFSVPSNCTMASFSIEVGGNLQINADRQPFTVRLFKDVQGVHSTNSIMGTLISEQKGIYLTQTEFPYRTNAVGWLTFDIANQNLEGGRTYAFMLFWDRFGMQVFKNDRYGSYSGGQLWQSHDRMNCAPYGGGSNDLYFCVQSVP